MRAVIIASDSKRGRYIAETESNRYVCLEAQGLDIAECDQIRGDFVANAETRLICFGNVCVDVYVAACHQEPLAAFEWLGTQG